MKKPLAIFRTKKKTMDEQNSKETQTPRNTNHPENKTKKIHPGKLVFCGAIGSLGIISNRQKQHPSAYNSFTLPKTNIAPENRPLEKEIPIGNHHF